MTNFKDSYQFTDTCCAPETCTVAISTSYSINLGSKFTNCSIIYNSIVRTVLINLVTLTRVCDHSWLDNIDKVINALHTAPLTCNITNTCVHTQRHTRVHALALTVDFKMAAYLGSTINFKQNFCHVNHINEANR